MTVVLFLPCFGKELNSWFSMFWAFFLGGGRGVGLGIGVERTPLLRFLHCGANLALCALQ